jgi:hypothetical protein
MNETIKTEDGTFVYHNGRFVPIDLDPKPEPAKPEPAKRPYRGVTSKTGVKHVYNHSTGGFLVQFSSLGVKHHGGVYPTMKEAVAGLRRLRKVVTNAEGAGRARERQGR